MKNFTLALLFLFPVLHGISQVEWDYSIGGGSWETPMDICTDKDNNIYIVGTYMGVVDFDPSQNSLYDTAVYIDLYIQKMSPNKEHLWTKFIKGTSNTQIASIVCDDDHVYVSGGFTNSVDLDPGTGTQFAHAQNPFSPNIAFLKLTLDGDFVWGKSLPGIASSPYGISLDIHGNLYMTGAYAASMDFDPSENWHIAPANTQAAQNSMNGFISKYDADGNFMWVSPINGSSNDYATSIVTDPNGYSYISGKFSGTVDFDQGPELLELSSPSSTKYLAKYDPDGNPLWAKIVQPSIYFEDDLALSAKDENVYFVGFGGTSEGTDVLKVNPQGEILWNQRIEVAHGNSLVTDQDGNVFVSGYFGHTVDFDPGPNVAELTASDTVGGFESDIFLLKLDENGNYLFSTKFGDVQSDIEAHVTNSSDNHIYLTGVFRGTVAIDNASGDDTLTSNGQSDILVLKIHPGMELSAEENCQDIDVYPNPATSNVIIHNHFSENVNIIIYNAQGLLVYENSFANNSTAIPFDRFAQGMYIIHVKSDLCEKKVKVLKN